MTTATLHSAAPNTFRQQLAKLRRALGSFSSALYNAQAREFPVAEPVAPVALSTRTRQRALEELFSLADKYQDHSPSLSAELRFFASRG